MGGTKGFLPSENYLDPDVAYLLGMMAGRGSLTEQGDNRRLVIEFPFRALRARGLSCSFDQRTHVQLAVGQIRDRIENLIDADFSTDTTDTNCRFILRFLRPTLTWRNLKYVTDGWRTFRGSTVPDRIYDAPLNYKKEFVRGIADVCGFVRASNHYRDGRHRVYLEIPAENWRLPIALCRLLQVDLDVPVQCIQWNHPNTRIPKATSAKLTKREHQVKVFAEAFLPIGFHVDYKQQILEELAAANSECNTPNRCNPNPEAHRTRRKPHHPEEQCRLIPKRLRGTHFDAYWQICLEMGCKQFCPIDPDQGELWDDPLEPAEDAEDAEK